VTMLIDTRGSDPPPGPARRRGPDDWRPWGWALGSVAALAGAASLGGVPGLALSVAGVVALFRGIGAFCGDEFRGLGEWRQ
jgi:hypothetical protein